MTFKLSRRTFLRGQGALLALPLLEAMLPARAHAGGARPPVRYALIYFPNGATPDWAPTETGTQYALTPLLSSLEPYREDLIVCTNVETPIDSFHPGHVTGFSTGVSPPRSGAPYAAAVSVDQLIAQGLGATTRLRSLVLSPAGVGESESGQSGVYGSSLSWTSATTPAARSVSPRQIFEALMGGATSEPGDSNAAQERMARKRSVLDYVLRDAQRLQGRLGSSDRATLDQFMTHVREVEQKLSAPAPQGPKTTCGADFPPPSEVDAFEEDLKLKLDLVALAFQCDATRVASYLLDFERSSRDFAFAGASGNHHDLSHAAPDTSAQGKYRKIISFYFSRLAYLLARLKEMPEAGSTVLANSMIVFGSAFSDGADHTQDNIPLIVAGGGGGSLRPGRCIRFPNGTGLPQLHLAMMRKLGLQTSSFNGHTVAAAEL